MKMLHLLLVSFVLLVWSPAHAATFARIGNGEALDVISGATLHDALSGRFADNYNPSPYWTQVPDADTTGAALQSGAKVNGDGTYTNPAPYAPPKPTTITVTEFKKRLTLAEKLAVVGSADPEVKVFWDELNTAPTVNLTDTDTVGGVDYLVTVNILSMQRAAAILTP